MGGKVESAVSIGVIGLGAIGRTVVDCVIRDSAFAHVKIAAVLVRSGGSAEAAIAHLGRIPVVCALPELLDKRPDIAVECAGQSAVADYGPAILSHGIDLMVSSTGALADDGLFAEMTGAASRAEARILIPAGAIAGLDGLGALKLAGLDAVTYRSVKPLVAWRGTEAEQLVDLDAIDAPTTFFRGTARQAARRFPKNANLAATVALAGSGFEGTSVELVADPGSSANVGMIEAESRLGTMTVVISGTASSNPKTSASTAFSLLHAILSQTGCVVI